ncbi:MAG: PAS domain S-box protein [Thermodesulfobacteriota bacterium]
MKKEAERENSQPFQGIVKSDEEYRIILESIQDGYCEMDLSGNFTFFNTFLTRILGYSHAELIGMDGRKIMDEPTAKKVFRTFRDIYRSGKPVHGFDYEVIRKDGARRQIEVSASLVRRGDGRAVGFRSIVRDITERKKAEADLRQARDELERRVAERTAELDKMNKELEIKTIKLEEANIALKMLLKKKDENKAELEQNMLFNVRELIIPVLDKLKVSGLDDRQRAYAGVMENNLNDIISPFVQGLTYRYYSLTPTEVQIANFVKQGKSTKEIAVLLNLSAKTVETHRRNIRRKIGLKRKKINLRTHLQSIQ